MAGFDKFSHLVKTGEAWICKSKQKTAGESIKDYKFMMTRKTRVFQNKIFRPARSDDVGYCQDYPKRSERYLIDHAYVSDGNGKLVSWRNT